MENNIKVENKDQSAFAMCMFDATSGASLIEYGLSKREYFAAKAMKGILASRGLQEALNQDRIAWEDCAVEYADKLLRALEKK